MWTPPVTPKYVQDIFASLWNLLNREKGVIQFRWCLKEKREESCDMRWMDGSPTALRETVNDCVRLLCEGGLPLSKMVLTGRAMGCHVPTSHPLQTDRHVDTFNVRDVVGWRRDDHPCRACLWLSLPCNYRGSTIMTNKTVLLCHM